jgi:deoxyribose-phosphate aldolase
MTETCRALAAMIDHTLLTPEATADDVAALCEEARELHVCAVCISPTMVALASDRLRGSPVKVASVIGFPSGAHRSKVKACEAARAGADGADEADMVINLGLALAGDWDGVRADITAVREVLTGGQILKVIIETAVLTPSQITAACHAAETAGADFVKSSTGFHPAGGATSEAIRIMAATVGGRLGVKASGGIHTAQAALALVDAGATRLGLSSTAAVLTELDRSAGRV